MWIFTGDIEAQCKRCKDSLTIPIGDFDHETGGDSERSMGPETLHDLAYEYECGECANSISIKFEVLEYPLEIINYIDDSVEGANVDDKPEIVELEEMYSFNESDYELTEIQKLIPLLKLEPELVRALSPTEFEEFITEIFRSNGFEVVLTKRTRDGGKDIIAIETNSLGIKTKYFIECKRHQENNKISVSLVRQLQGVKNTKDGPNQVILVTSSYFTSDAKKFAKEEANSRWDISLKDYDDLVGWLSAY